MSEVIGVQHFNIGLPEGSTPWRIRIAVREYSANITIFEPVYEGREFTYRWLVDGSIRWDGCSNFEHNDCLHYYGPEDVQRYADLLMIAYSLADEHVPKWDSCSPCTVVPSGYTVTPEEE